ncbi:hypothetical protein INS49_004597 [Diaporthe citri]|uniref:uncharacterized protein n=1 Tax=Diaporthe citri TaxID=83186 RepID=UPI001C812877|nr:uncharacterized protein INS49_004597 [Diaporthe citri]KAG6354579.1 hypothetical protein INS49_004597 [Diaporthe citri]
MDHNTTLALEATPEMAFANRNEAIKIVIGILSPAVASETASFMVDATLQLCPESMRGRPRTPAATSLREHHLTVLMTQVARAYAEGRGQDFADSRFAINNLLQEEPEHQPLAARFRALMGLWLQGAHNKRQQEEFERRQKRQRDEEEEREMKELQEGKAKDNEESDGEEAVKAVKTSAKSPSSTASADSQRVSKDGDEVEGSSAAARTKTVFDLSGLIDTDENESSSDDDETSSDEE